ncbi:aspartate/glutamate racemase family protein [Roseovarius sp. SYSU LYC5161]|uniref:maleate cis-trans isomerase family protein n=1 Tax=Roseovarius halophilus (ex Wu et al. 2025) TaxID=3376060 RepID=UPI002870E25F|nr:aspartate/glutamate racemase family protein [Roseovarius sp.]
MKYDLDAGAGDGLRLGLIVLSTDETLEFEARKILCGRPANMMHTRIPSAADVTPDDLRSMADSMTETAARLPADLGAVAYACTSGATLIGPGEVERLVQTALPDVPVTNPMSAVIAALNALGARRIGMVTPYVPEVVRPMQDHLAANGIETVAEVSFGEKDDRTVARISEQSTLAAMREAASENVDAVFASCTNLRTFDVIEQAEKELGLPVISSNSALLWHLLRRAGAETDGWGPGRLFTPGGAHG